MPFGGRLAEICTVAPVPILIPVDVQSRDSRGADCDDADVGLASAFDVFGRGDGEADAELASAEVELWKGRTRATERCASACGEVMPVALRWEIGAGVMGEISVGGCGVPKLASDASLDTGLSLLTGVSGAEGEAVRGCEAD